MRQELAPLGIDVAALHVGYMDTAMADHVAPGETPSRLSLPLRSTGIAAGETEILADEITRTVKQGLSAAPVAA